MAESVDFMELSLALQADAARHEQTEMFESPAAQVMFNGWAGLLKQEEL